MTTQRQGLPHTVQALVNRKEGTGLHLAARSGECCTPPTYVRFLKKLDKSAAHGIMIRVYFIKLNSFYSVLERT
jgi:hypothetical protein